MCEFGVTMKKTFTTCLFCIFTVSIAPGFAAARATGNGETDQQTTPPARVGTQQPTLVEVENWTKPQAGWLYVLDARPNVGDTGGHVWLLDPENGKVMGSIHTGNHPDFALSPDGSRLYIASETRVDGARLGIVDTSSGEVFGGEVIYGRITPNIIPAFSTMAVSGDGKFLRILVRTPDSDSAQLDTINADSGKRMPGLVHLGNCSDGQFVSVPTASRVDVVCPNVKKVHVVRTDEKSRELDNTNGQWPWNHRFGVGTALPSPDGKSVAVVRGDGGVFLMDLVTLTFHSTVAPGGAQEQISQSAWPESPDGSKIYIGNHHSVNAVNANAREIRVYDTTTWKKLSSMKTSIPFWSAAVSGDGKRLYAIAPEQKTILVIDTSTMKEIRSVSVGAMPALAVAAP
jgi:YVTN family beta-propeller protein